MLGYIFISFLSQNTHMLLLGDYDILEKALDEIQSHMNNFLDM